MKKIAFSGVILLALVLGITMTQCKKDNDCEVVITVKYLDDNNPETTNDTNIVVKRAYVQIGNNPLYAEYAQASGYTDAAGEFRHTFQYESLLDVEVTYTTPDSLAIEFAGKSEVKLVPGETVYKTVYISPL